MSTANSLLLATVLPRQNFVILLISHVKTNRIFVQNFTDHLHQITKTRNAIEVALNNGLKAYGMNTLFGHLDANTTPVVAEDFQNLLHMHLVGSPTPASPRLIEWLWKAKMSQLIQGQSGISPENFIKIAKLGDTPDGFNNWTGCFDLSYGSGSVIPGAWFAYGLQEKVGFDITVPGDLMAIINGDFVSVAQAGSLVEEVSPLISAAMSAIAETQRSASYKGVQFSVSMRDIQPLTQIVATAQDRMKEVVEQSLQKPSGNPLYVESDSGITVRSNSSFLNFPLSMAVGNYTQSIQLVLSYLLGATRHIAKILEFSNSSDNEDSPVKFSTETKTAITTLVGTNTDVSPTIRNVKSTSIVQPVKALQALCMRDYGISKNFAIAESHEIEDIADRSIESIITARSVATDLREALSIFNRFIIQRFE